MKFKYTILVVTDKEGNKAVGVVGDMSDDIQISGMFSEGERVYFESDAYHLDYWCSRYGFKYQAIEKEQRV